jgi:hypothetical protein
MPDEADIAEVGRVYAEAFAGFDEKRLKDVLAPDLRYREVTPAGFLDLRSAAAFLGETSDFLQEFESWETVAATSEAMGDRVLATTRVRLHYGTSTYLVEHREVLTITDGRVVAIDGVCTGARPEA